MNILALIKDRLIDTIVEKVSNFLGEHPENISSALNSAVSIVLGSIIRNTSNDEDTGKIMDVLKDGGHTGEILDDLPILLESFDKTQLLITIGSNIFNHFAGNKSNGIIEKLSSLTGIRKTSASSLVGLAAPLVLGALGKVVTKESLGISGLAKLLSEQQESVFGALPPAITNQLNFKTAGLTLKKEPEEGSNETKKDRRISKHILNLIPWVLIGSLVLAGLAYFWKYHKNMNFPKADTAIKAATGDSLATDNISSPTPPIDTANLDFNHSIKQNIGESSVEKEKNESSKPTEEKPKDVPEAIMFENSTSDNKGIEQQLRNSSSWISINTNFKKNSAEIRSKGGLDGLTKYLKAHQTTKIILAGGSQNAGQTLGEDRAFAIREVLLEKGINEEQIIVQRSLVKEINSQVALKIK